MGSIIDIIRRCRILAIRISCKYVFCTIRKIPVVTIVAPHPDDEIIGCSGLIQQLPESGKKVDIIYLTGGGKSHSGCCNIDESTLITHRRELARKSASILGIPQENLHFLDYPDGGIAFDCDETERLKSLLGELKPDAVFIPHKGEGWSDHVEAGNIVKSLLNDNKAVEIYEYCVWFWYYNVRNIDWKNAKNVAMTKEQHKKKLQAMDAYIKPLAPCGKPWSGVLPKVFVWANRWNKELYFKVK